VPEQQLDLAVDLGRVGLQPAAGLVPGHALGLEPDRLEVRGQLVEDGLEAVRVLGRGLHHRGRAKREGAR